MSLTGRPLACLLIVAVAAVLATTVWKWDRLAGRGARRLAARLVALLLCQSLVTLTALTMINRHFGFYGTWGELVGAAGVGSVHLVQDQQHGGTAASSTLIRRDPDLTIGTRQDRDGRLDTVDIRGIRSGLHASAYVYLPPQYFQRGAEHRRFPVAMAFSGYPGAQRNLVTQIRVPQTARAETNAGRTQPLIYVMLRPSMLPGRDTECTDIPGGPQTATFFTQDVPEAIRSTYRVSDNRKGWAIFGFSTGGYCSLKLAMRHSDTFSKAASISGYYNAIKDITTGDLYGGSQQVRNENDLFWRLQHRPQPPISILLTTTKSEENHKNETQHFLSQVKPPLQASSIILEKGGHNFQTWRHTLPQVLTWLTKSLSA